MSGHGLGQQDIGAMVGVSAKTLRKHCREELDRGWAKTNAMLGQTSIRKALGMLKDGDTKPNVELADKSLLIFYAKTRLGFRDRVEVTGANGGPIEVKALDRLSDAQLEMLIEIHETLALTHQPADDEPNVSASQH